MGEKLEGIEEKRWDLSLKFIGAGETKREKKLFQSLNCFTSISYIIKFSKKKKSVEVLIQGLPQLTHTYIKKIIIFF